MIIFTVKTKPAGNREVAGGDDVFRVLLARRVSRQNIAGDLFANELIVRFVLIEGADYVVAVEIGFRHGIVGRFAGGVGVTNHVEPVSSPLFTVVPRGQ